MQRSRGSDNTYIKVGISVLVVLLFLSVLQWFFPGSVSIVRQLFWRAAAPTSNLLTTPDADTIASLQQERDRLRDALYTTLFDYTELQSLREENQELRAMLSFAENSDATIEGASILGEEVVDSVTMFIINRGSRDGIEVGFPVVAEAGVLVGIVVHVDHTISYVVPITQNTTTLSARLLHDTGRIHGVVEGIPGVATRLNLIPKDVTITPGDVVVTSGLDPQVPEDLVIGIIDNVLPTPNDFFQTASIQFLAEYKEYETVFVIHR